MRWYYGWNVIAVGLVFQAVTFGIALFCFTFWVEPWMVEFNVGRGQIMTIMVILNVVMGVAAPFAGPAMDKLSIRVLVTAGTICFAAGLALASFATALWQIILIYGVLITPGTLLAGPLAAQTLAAKWFRARRGMAIGFSSVGTSLGGAITPLIVAGLIADLGWRPTNQILAAVSLAIILPLVWLVVRNTPEDKGIEPEPEAEVLAEHAHLGEFPEWTTRTILGQRSFWIPILAFLPVMMAFGSVQFNLAPYVSDKGFDPAKAAVLMSLLSITMVGGKVFFGAMSDRLDHRVLYWIAAAFMVVGIFILIVSGSYKLLVLASLLMGFAAGGFLPLLGAIVASRFGAKAFGRVYSLVGPFLTINAFAPQLAGWMRDTTGSYDVAFQILVALMIPVSLVMVMLRSPSEVRNQHGLDAEAAKAA